MGKVLIVRGADFSEVALDTDGRLVHITRDDLIPSPDYYISSEGEIKAAAYDISGKNVDVSSYQGKTIKVTKATGKLFSRVSFLKSTPVAGSQGDFASGYESTYFETIESTEWVGVIPNDATYLYIQINNPGAGGDIFPDDIIILLGFPD